MYGQYYHTFNEINALPKLESYKLYKTSFQVEQYLNCINNNNKHRLALTRFRCSSNNLLIEEEIKYSIVLYSKYFKLLLQFTTIVYYN